MSMTITVDNKEKSVEFVILKEPAYIWQVLNKKDADKPPLKIQEEVRRLIKIFDSKPMTIKCSGCPNRTATRYSIIDPTSPAYWWCDVCRPDSMGCERTPLVGSTYVEVLHHAILLSKSFDLKGFIKELAVAKGLPPKRITEKQAVNFFK